MRFGGFEFRPRLVPTLAAVGVIALTVALGRWQLNRAAEKQTLREQWELMAAKPPIVLSGKEQQVGRLRFRRVVAEGNFLREFEILLDNKFLDDQPGYHVIVPLRILSTGRVVLVNRGWVARGKDYRTPPEVETPQALARIEGIASIPTDKFLELSRETIEGRVWQNLVLSRYKAKTGLDVMPIVILQQNGVSSHLVQVSERPDTRVAMHYGYAFQWFALAAATFLIYVIVNTQRAPQSR